MRISKILCRAMGVHALELKPPIYVLPDGAREVHFECARCETTARDVWQKRTGKRLKGRTYKRDEEYAAFIKENDHADARAAILEVSREVNRGTSRTHLRLLPGKQAKARRGHKAARG